MRHARSWFALATAVAMSTALIVTATVSARTGSSAKTCHRQLSAAAPNPVADPVAIESSLLRQLISTGWKPTAAGEALLAGRLPAAQRAVDGSLDGGAQLAIAPAPGARSLQAARRATAAQVFLLCGVGQAGNVNFYEAAGTYAWVSWELHNLSTGAIKNVRSAETFYCPANSGGCFEYFYLKPAAPWFVWAATEQTVASPINEYCSP